MSLAGYQKPGGIRLAGSDDDGDEAGVDDSLVGGDEGEAVNTGGADDRAVPLVGKTLAERRDLTGGKSRRVRNLAEFASRETAISRRLIALIATGSHLFLGEPPGRGDPADSDMRVEQKSGVQIRDLRGSRTTSHRSAVSALGSRSSSGIVIFPARMPSGDFQAVRRAGPASARGLPRRVIVILSPRSATPFSSERHLALNSQIEIAVNGCWHTILL
jgi:hypothetical protein